MTAGNSGRSGESKLAGRKAAGPKLAGPKLAGRKLAGPKLAGPKLAGPNRVGPNRVGLAPRHWQCSFIDDRPRASQREPASLGALLRDVVSRLRPVLGSVLPPAPETGSARGASRSSSRATVTASLDRLSALWATTVGESFAEHSRATSFRSGTLMVVVDGAPLAHELGFAREELIDALVSQGLKGVHDIRFKVG